MKNRTLDGIIETFMYRFKGMSFPNTPEGWEKHSVFMPLAAKASMHVELEYQRQFDVDNADAWNEMQDDNNESVRRRMTVIPRFMYRITFL